MYHHASQLFVTREITHIKAFTAALESMGKDRFTIGKIAPTVGLVGKATTTNILRRKGTREDQEGELTWLTNNP